MIDTVAGGTPRRARGRAGGTILAFVAGVVLTLVALWFLAPRFGLRIERPTAATAPAPMPVAAAPARTQPIEVLSAREGLLAARLTALEGRLAVVDSDANEAASSASRAENMLVMLSARRAVDRGRPLDYLEGQLRSRFGGTRPEAVRTLIAAASQPVTLEDLRSGLADLSPRLLAGTANDGWWRGIQRELSQLIVIRQGSAPSPRGVDRVERARRRLDGGQVESAIAEVERLPGAERAGEWLAMANRYVAARRALAELEQGAAELPPAPAPTAAPLPAPPSLSGEDPAPYAAPIDNPVS